MATCRDIEQRLQTHITLLPNQRPVCAESGLPQKTLRQLSHTNTQALEAFISTIVMNCMTCA